MKGLYLKYYVRRVDNTDLPGGKHHGCRLFVLDITHDPAARAAALAYADATPNQDLARDLRSEVDKALAQDHVDAEGKGR